MTDSSTQGIQTVLHPVSDLEKAKTMYTALLGVAPQADGPYYVGFEEAANLDEGAMWPVSFALKKLAPAEEKRIAALIKKAVS